MTASERRILLIDVDGTLVAYTSDLPASAVTALRRARRCGHRVYIVTGRSRADLGPRFPTRSGTSAWTA